jgi:O-antigen/teichoic acid export membrane protein
MLTARIRNFQFGLMLATALSVSLWPAASQAYSDEQQQACTAMPFGSAAPRFLTSRGSAPA